MGAEQGIVSADAGRRFCQEVLRRAGVPEDGAFLAADALIDADLRGVSTHGAAVLQEAQAVGREHGVLWPA